MRLSLDDLISPTFVKYGKIKEITLSLPNGSELSGKLGESSLFDGIKPKREQVGIYLISSPISELVYAGSASCLYRRFENHCLTLRNNKNHNRNLQEIFNTVSSNKLIDLKYFEIQDRELAYDIEQFLIDRLDELGLLANHSTNARISAKGYVITEETREKFRKIARERVMSEDTCKKISLALAGVPANPERAKRLGDLSRSLRNDPAFVSKWRKKRCRPVEIDGIEYFSLSEAGKHHGCTAGRVLARILSPNEKFKGWNYKQTPLG